MTKARLQSFVNANALQKIFDLLGWSEFAEHYWRHCRSVAKQHDMRLVHFKVILEADMQEIWKEETT